MTIGEKIKEQRIKKNWTQEELAKKLHVSRSTISGWEVGRNYPDLITIIQISNLFDYSLDQLLREDNKMTDQISNHSKNGKLYRRIILGIVILFFSNLIYSYYLTGQTNQYTEYLVQEGWAPDKEQVSIYKKTEKEVTYLVSITRVYAANLFYLKNQRTLVASTDQCEIQIDSFGQISVKVPKEFLLTDTDYLIMVDEEGRLLPITSQISIETAESIKSYLVERQTTHQKLINGLLAKEKLLTIKT